MAEGEKKVTISKNMPTRRKIVWLSLFLLVHLEGAACDTLLFSESFDTIMMNMVAAGWTGDFDQTVAFDEGWTVSSGTSTQNHLNPDDPTGPMTPYAGAQYIYFETSGPAPISATSQITSPEVFIPGAGASLSFFLFMHGADMGSLEINALVGPDVIQLALFTEEIQPSKLAPWQYVSIDISAFRDSSIRIQFIGQKGSTDLGDIAIDELSICASREQIVPTMSTWAICILILILLILSVSQLRLITERDQRIGI